MNIAYQTPVRFSYHASGDTLAFQPANYTPQSNNTNGFAFVIRNATAAQPGGGTMNYSASDMTKSRRPGRLPSRLYCRRRLQARNLSYGR